MGAIKIEDIPDPEGRSGPNSNRLNHLASWKNWKKVRNQFQVFNVLDYGAKGDGVTDDRSAILRTIDAASSGSEVFFPRGTGAYLISYYIPCKTGVSIRCERGTVIKVKDSAAWTSPGSGPDYGVFDCRSVNTVSIRGFEIDGNKANNATQRIFGVCCFNATGIQLNNLYIHDAPALTSAGVLGGDGLYFEETANASINGIKIRDCVRQGISFVGGVTNKGSLYLSDIDIAGITGTNPGLGIDFEVDGSYEIDGVVIDGLVIDNCRGGGLSVSSKAVRNVSVSNFTIKNTTGNSIGGIMVKNGANEIRFVNGLVRNCTGAEGGICVKDAVDTVPGAGVLFSNVIARENQYTGIRITNSRKVTLSNCSGILNKREGLAIEPVTGGINVITVIGGVYANNSQDGANAFNDIEIYGGVGASQNMRVLIDALFAGYIASLGGSNFASYPISISSGSNNNWIGVVSYGLYLGSPNPPVNDGGSGNNIAFRKYQSDVTFYSSILLDAVDAYIRSDTSDGADNKRVVLTGGGGSSNVETRGAYLALAGNENSQTGKAELRAGDVAGGTVSLLARDNEASAISLKEASNPYWEVDTLNGSEVIRHGNAVTNPVHSFLGSGAAAFNGDVTLAATKVFKISGVQVLAGQQTGLGAALAAGTAGATYTATEQAMLQALNTKLVAVETILRAHGMAAT